MSILDKKHEIESEVRKIVNENKAELIDFGLFISRGKSILRCVVDRAGGGITTGDCAQINKKIFFYLEESVVLGQDYVVEVNSPGLDRPLKNEKDFCKAKGRAIALWLNEPVNEKSYLEAELSDVKEGKLFLIDKKEAIEVDINKIKLGKEIIKI